MASVTVDTLAYRRSEYAHKPTDMHIHLYSAYIKFEEFDSIITGERVDELENDGVSRYLIDVDWYIKERITRERIQARRKVEEWCSVRPSFHHHSRNRIFARVREQKRTKR